MCYIVPRCTLVCFKGVSKLLRLEKTVEEVGIEQEMTIEPFLVDNKPTGDLWFKIKLGEGLITETTDFVADKNDVAKLVDYLMQWLNRGD